jgi:hypothetical protein
MKTLLFNSIHHIREQLLQHTIYREINTAERLRIFMKHHVFAVWDFMSLLKRLQQSLTCLTIPWVPCKQTNYAHFINEIVINEETDQYREDSYLSHFELYLQAMKEVGADITPISQYLQLISANQDPLQSIYQPYIPLSVAQFVSHNLHLAMNGQAHEVASAFFFGREDLIPDMFAVLLQELKQNGIHSPSLLYYLQRHIELDGDKHGPLAEKLLVFLCGNDANKLEDTNRVATNALQARIRLWDGVLAEIKEKNS